VDTRTPPSSLRPVSVRDGPGSANLRTPYTKWDAAPGRVLWQPGRKDKDTADGAEIG